MDSVDGQDIGPAFFAKCIFKLNLVGSEVYKV
ncbi:hypothetical protein SAMN05421639_107102 [Chryseobacterium shigense]|uniref:Uncharacterized protein n=1 Tax=Chryseobacterium shigense TaxID=297244 RepID=A0A1N7JQB8_9FLAO|nr:hypothetical protein SAMN05421639_107102 [Chryseobacterium shigense]